MRYFFFIMFIIFFLLSCEKNTESLVLTSNESTKQIYTQIETFITYDDIFKNSGSDRVQDFDLDADYLYVHPIAAYGLYKYSFTDDTLIKLVDYGAGNYIAQDSFYVFYETCSYSICRFNLIKDTTDLIFDLSELDYTNIDGMEVYEHINYIYMHSQQSGNKFLAKFDLNGKFIESIPYARMTIHMSIYNNIVYAIYYPDEEHAKFSCFSLITKSFLTDAELPTQNFDGIRIVDDKLYFTDYEKREINTISMTDIK